MAEMPRDWDDHAGWEAYFAELVENEEQWKHAARRAGTLSRDRLDEVVGNLQRMNFKDVWLPGCGLSPLPRAFSLLGFSVQATDIAPTAVAHQECNADQVRNWLLEGPGTTPLAAGSFQVRTHDFREPLPGAAFDAIFNVKAVQGLPPISMQRACQVHFDALRPGGQAVFDTMNVQGQARVELETCLVQAGFYVPGYEASVRYHREMQATGIPYVLYVGSPFVWNWDPDYPHEPGSPEYERDELTIRRITTEHRARLNDQLEREKETLDPDHRRATVIYSTG